MRFVIFWIHLPLGLAVGLVVLLTSVSGVLLTYELQLTRWALRDVRVSPPADGRPLPLDRLLDRITVSRPDAVPTSLVFHADPREPVAVGVGGRRLLFVNPYTGIVVGNNDRPLLRAFRVLVTWHRWLGRSGDTRIIGRTIVAVSNLGFLVLLISGFALWWFRRSGWATLWFRAGLMGWAREFNWHNVIGFWLFMPLIVIGFSGATISYREVANMVHLAVGEAPPRPAAVDSAREGPYLLRLAPPARNELDTMIRLAAAETPGWKRLTVHVPDTSDRVITITVDRGTGRQPSRQADLVFDRTTHELVERGGYPSFSRGVRVRRWLRFAHTGEVYGLVGQTVAAVSALGACFLVWTGLTMAWRRLIRSRRRPRHRATAVEKVRLG